jgi:hypothetical protein
MTFRRVSIVSLAFLMLIAQAALAEVKTVERTKVEFPGMLGGIMKVFGGKSASEGVVNKVALKGNRKMTSNEDTAELVDLTEEKVYQIDVKKKTYTVLTFAQMKQQMIDAMAKAKADAASAAQTPAPKPDPAAPPAPPPQKPDVVIDFKLQESGQKKAINGFDCREVVATITVRQKDKPADDGSMVMTTSMWLTPTIAALKELEEFDRRYAEKLVIPDAQEMARQIQMAPAVAAYPGLGDMMGKLEVEKVKMDGTTVLTSIRVEAVGNPDQAQADKPKPAPAEQPKQSGVPTSLGGLLGGLGKKAAPKPDTTTTTTTTDSNKSGSLMSTNHELLSVSTSVADSDVSIPAGFKEKK